jgi:hypothetical protein
MSLSEREYLLELWRRNICPNCGKNIPEGTRVDRGNKADGGFCSLDCFAKYRKIELPERAKRVAALAARQRDL